MSDFKQYLRESLRLTEQFGMNQDGGGGYGFGMSTRGNRSSGGFLGGGGYPLPFMSDPGPPAQFGQYTGPPGSADEQWVFPGGMVEYGENHETYPGEQHGTYPNGGRYVVYPDGRIVYYSPDGTLQGTNNGDGTYTLPDGTTYPVDSDGNVDFDNPIEGGDIPQDDPDKPWWQYPLDLLPYIPSMLPAPIGLPKTSSTGTSATPPTNMG